jgi:hypothetical protein
MPKALLFIFIAAILLASCQKQSDLNGNARLFIPVDSVSFDTVFTTQGSVTQQVKLINNNSGVIALSSINLLGGANSPFIINIDGSPGPTASNLRIQSNDSLYIFITVYIKPGLAPTPFILQDSIQISYNGIQQYIKLSAWGQNAHFLTNQVIQNDTNWPNDLPYVISGGLTVNANTTLTIQPGVHIYMHADAPLYIDGTLQVLGDTAETQRVYFTGDRLDQPYSRYPGSWPGIYFRNTSKDNLLNYAVIQNGYHSLVAEGPSTDTNPKLILNQCFINNSFAEGILGIQSSIKAINCLVTNCGQNIVIGLGGDYQFEFCTVASYSNNLIYHQQPVLTVSNAGTDGTQVLTSGLNASFVNCIFWGSDGVPDEALILKQGSTVFNVLFAHTILKQQNYPQNIDSSALWLNTDPMFTATGNSGNLFDFHLQAGSPAVDHGADLGILIDLDGFKRPVNLPDLGCYERQ